ncbi:MAG: metallophosphoesterase [Clostridia bacterium]|nr:metallophosphoesterase [Clostridia bacterium]
MKKILSVVLALSLIFGMFAMTSVAADDGITITVGNDIHYNKKYTEGPAKKHNSLNADFAHVSGDDKMTYENFAVISAFLEAAGTNESDCVILPGDLADTGAVEEAKEVAAILRNFEANYGKQVYVVPGNHDLMKTTVAEFEEIYAEFGYNEAIAQHEKTGSYVADLENDYRLLAIDSNTPGTGKHSIDEEFVSWVTEQCNKAKADGKKVFAMMHHNLLEHFILGSTIHSGGVVGTKVAGFADALAKGGVKYIFTGHTHDSDVAMYTADDGSILYDVVTATLLTYTCPYRVVSFGKNVKIETRNVTEIDTSLLPEGISENALALAESDFTEYTRICTFVGLEAFFKNFLTGKNFKKLLNLEDEKMNEIIEAAGDKLNEVLTMPLEKADETEEGKSLQSLAEKYDTEIPDTDYKNLIDVTSHLYVAHNLGDENYPTYSDEVVLIVRGVAIALGYALQDVTAEEYATVMSFLFSLADINVPVDFLKYAGSCIKRMEGIEIYITTVLVPFLGEFTVDNAPADNNVTLPGYPEAADEGDEDEEIVTDPTGENKSFFEKLTDFFDKIFGFVKTLFAFLPWVN